jgi:hypothetical protein
MQMYLINYILPSLTWQSRVKLLALFSADFFIYNETNTVRCLITYQIVFYIVEFTKNLSLKHIFC